MTEDYNRTTPHVGTNWWDMASSRTSATATSSSSSNLTSSGRGGYVGSGGGWLLGGSAGEAAGIGVSLVRRSSSSMDNHSSGVSGNGMDNYHPDGSHLQVMGLGLSCHPHQSMDWNHQTALLEKGGEIGGFRSMLQEGMAAATDSANFQHNETAGGGGGMLFGSQMGQWKPSNLSYSERSLFPPAMQQQQQQPTGGNNNMNAPSTRGFSPSSDQLGLSSTSTCSRIDNSTCQQGSLLMPPSSSTTYHTALDSSSSSSVYDSPNSSSSSLLQGLIISPNPPQSSSSNSSYGYHNHHHHEQDNYVGLPSNNNHNESSLMGNSNWPPPPPTPTSSNSNKMMSPQFLRNAGTVVDKELNNNQLLHFTNNGPFWNSTTDTSGDVRPGLFFPSLMQNQMGNNTTAMPTFEEKPKISQYNSTAPTSSAQKKSSTSQTARTSSATTAATGLKRSRGETTMPPFKVRKEKMGDRITALQQLVSPFGKTDTASVLSETIEYIKILHEQVSLLSTPYLKSGTGGSSLQHQQKTQQSCDKSKELPEGPRRDLRSRGLCLVPVSSTFPIAHETSVDFWTPTFGGTFR